MSFEIIALCIIMIVFSWKKEEQFFNPISIFVLYWLVLFLLSNAAFYDINILSDEAKKIVFTGLLGFSIGYVILILLSHGNRYIFFKVKNDQYLGSYSKRLKLIYALAIITIILLLPKSVNGILSLKSGLTFENIRNGETLSVVNSSNSNILGLLFQYVARPFALAILPICADSFWKDENNKLLTVLTIIITLLQLFAEGGRSCIIYFVIHLGVIYLLYRKKRDHSGIGLSEGYKAFMFILIAVAATVLILQVSLSRGSEDLLKSAYIYFCAPLQNMDAHLNYFNSSSIVGGGFASLYGFVCYLEIILARLSIKIPFFSSIQNSLLAIETPINIGHTINMNAFVTCFYYWYLDGRWWGLIVSGAIYAFVLGNVFRKIMYNFNSRDICLFSMLMQGIIFSMVRMQFSTVIYAGSFFLIMACFKKNYEYSDM